MYRLATKRIAKNESKKTPACFFQTHTTTRVLAYSALLTVENLS